MPILGTALREELVDAVGLKSLRQELRAELRDLGRELRGLRAFVRTLRPGRSGGAATAPRPESPAISAGQIRGLRDRLGETRKTFAQRLGVSPSIIFMWETGRSVPRRSAIVSRLQQLIASTPTAAATKERSAGGSNNPNRGKRALTLSPQRRASLKLQGQYMGMLRSLRPRQKAQVKAVKAKKGYPAAIELAKKLGRS